MHSGYDLIFSSIRIHIFLNAYMVQGGIAVLWSCGEHCSVKSNYILELIGPLLYLHELVIR